MSAELLLQAMDGEIRGVLREGEEVVEFFRQRLGESNRAGQSGAVEQSSTTGQSGTIYLGRVETILPGMQAAFVEIGLEKKGYLHAADVLPPSGERASVPTPLIERLLTQGQRVIVQITREASGSKGPRVTCNLTLPGHWLVLVPRSEQIGVSRKIESAGERERLRAIVAAHCPADCGVIVRTAAEGVSEAELLDDLQRLTHQWQEISEQARRERPPFLLQRNDDLITRLLRDVLTDAIERIRVNDLTLYRSILRWGTNNGIDLHPRLSLDSGADYWNEYCLQQELEKALRPKVWLKSGGFLVIEPTEALIVIDVNTGKYTGKQNLADTAHRTNLEAAQEIPRQLRLRNLGGIVIIDFIDMRDEDKQKEVIQTLQAGLRHDRTPTRIFGVTNLGLVEMTRKKVSATLAALWEQV
ncbi:Rne/Rng family ribonuclease [Heliophilum fasciatum]|uniref:Ribonuclease G n=1 Tax=Heliophilum fasciatum TaxID=35700 RepID=A0A4R2RXM1_9FIRM|nr:Rne/Rng family ribonuclease [Heliophilum fasciatum]MCW2277125.1 ribonuclease G [Heliophilum fasciatum]TCP68238.1 ribonuclease G [Heliophilum fasciatum]